MKKDSTVQQKYIDDRTKRGEIIKESFWFDDGGITVGQVFGTIIIFILFFSIGYSFPITNKPNPAHSVKVLNGVFSGLFILFWIIFKFVSVIFFPVKKNIKN